MKDIDHNDTNFKIHVFKCCDVSYDLCIKTMFGSSLPSAGGMLFVFIYVVLCPTRLYKKQELLTFEGFVYT